jgi:putative peptidoglycan lipid II flippase
VLANSVQLMAHAVIMFVLLHRRVGSLARQDLLPTLIKIVLASAVMGLTVYGAQVALRLALPGDRLLHRAVLVSGAAVVGTIFYAFVVLRLNVGEANLLLSILSRRVRRSHPVETERNTALD